MSAIITTRASPNSAQSWRAFRGPGLSFSSPDANRIRSCLPKVSIFAGAEAEGMPQTRFIVLCGHTHSNGIWKNRNITCHTAGSAYGRIDQSGMITLGKSVTFRRIDR